MADRTEISEERRTTSWSSDPITRWLLLVGALVFLMVLVGGFVRLSRAGLSIVEWNVILGVFPPIGEAAWQEAFEAYQATPEYELVNDGMSLDEFKWIFYLEWAHRLIARFAGLLVVVPLVWFIVRGVLTWRESIRYWAIAPLFAAQGVMGWVMVSSGLRDRPAVSDTRLTIHLMAALLLLGIVLWMALDRIQRDVQPGGWEAAARATRIVAWSLLVAVIVQIAWGGLVAGMKAGYLSNTWPLMFGQWIPSGWLTVADSWYLSLIEPLGAHFIHRWFAFVVAAFVVALFVLASRNRAQGGLFGISAIVLAITSVQIGLGIFVVLFGVPKWIALAHQGVGVALFCATLVALHRSEPKAAIVEADVPSRV